MIDIDVSIVVCTYNRAKLLRSALESLTKLHVGSQLRYEIVVVDNGSTDDTGRVIEEAARQTTVPVCGIHEPCAGVACARNCGIRVARGAWIAFFDDDQVAEPDWLLELFTMAKRKAARCVGGPVRLVLPETVLHELPRLCRRLLGESATVREPRKFDRKLSAGTGNLLVHRSIFEEVGLFDESLHEAGEDADFTRRIRAAGIDGWFAPSAVVHHAVPGYRLSDSYFRWTSTRIGMHIARHECAEWGRGGFWIIAAARFGQAALLHLPSWLGGHLLRSRAALLKGRCLLWRAQGYFRYIFSHRVRSHSIQNHAMSPWNFRMERKLFPEGKEENRSRTESDPQVL
ncbi:MAG: glycosyltransferase family 2 protein [Pirellulales bacterium]|nr:glycosyltransferase family 2 protein [Pirellulales bacterium]